MVRKHWYSPAHLPGEGFDVGWKKSTLTWGYFAGGLLVLMVMTMDLVLHRELDAILEGVYAILLLTSSVILFRTGRFFYTIATVGMIAQIVFPSLASWLAGGFLGSGGRGAWAFIAPISSALLLPDWCTALSFCVFLGSLIFLLSVHDLARSLPAELLPYLFVFHLAGVFFTSFTVFLYFYRKLEWQSKVITQQEAERQDLALKSEVLNMMSHEIRTPLNAIIGLLELIAFEELSARVREHFATIQNASRDLLSLVTDVLDYSKLSAGRVELEQIPMDAAGILRNAVAAQLLAAQENDTLLLFGLEVHERMWLEGDPTRLAQIVNNLVSNAVKFSAGRTVEVSASLSPAGFDLVVRDTGVGIPKARLDQIFKPFTQADSTITRKFGGTGLGLSIAHRIILAAQGWIKVRSEEGHGSEFLVHLPWKPVAAPTETPEATHLQKWNILVVDDNAVNRTVAARLLEKLGMQASCVDSGAKAIEWLQKNSCDLVFMDLQMPEMDGYEAADKIRHMFPGPIRIVALTAEVFESSQRLKDHGLGGFLGKPIGLERLRKCLLELQAGSEWTGAVQSGTTPISVS